MNFQAYIDDSMSDGRVLILAGYIASAKEWSAFETVWKERLLQARWETFHMKEIGSSLDEGRWLTAGWFYRAIEDHVRAFVALAVEIEPLKRAVTELGFRRAMNDPGYLDNPYILGFRAIFDATAQYQHELGIDGPIDFIFDDRKEEDRVVAGFDVFRRWCRADIRDRLGRPPRFGSDDEFLPLQAADLLAWHARRHWLRHSSITSEPLTMSWKPNRDIIGYRFNLDYTDIHNWLSTLKARVVASQAE